MKKDACLWIDYRRAVIVINIDQEEEIKRITPDVKGNLRYPGALYASGARNSYDGTVDPGHNRHFDNQLSTYYDEIISFLHDTTSILILGHGDAKVELQERLKLQEHNDRIIVVKPTGEMNENQILVRIRQHVQESQYRSNGNNHQHPTARGSHSLNEQAPTDLR